MTSIYEVKRGREKEKDVIATVLRLLTMTTKEGGLESKKALQIGFIEEL